MSCIPAAIGFPRLRCPGTAFRLLVLVVLLLHLATAMAVEIKPPLPEPPPSALPELEQPLAQSPIPPPGMEVEALEAVAALYRGRWNQALDLSAKAIGQGTPNPSALATMAIAAAVIGNRKLIDQVLPKLIELEQPPYFAKLVQAIQALKAGNTAAADEQLAPLLARKDVNPLVIYFHGEAQQMEGHLKEALGSFRKVVGIAPDFAPGLAAVSRLLPQERTAEATKLMERAVSIHPENAAYRRRLAELYARAGRKEEADRLLVEALRNIPGVKDQYLATAWQLERSGKPGEARKRVERALGYWGPTTLAYLVDAMASVDLGETERAKQRIGDYLRISKHKAQAEFTSGLVFLAMGDGTEADTHFTQAIELQPANLQARVNLAVAQQLAGQPGIAAKTLGQALQAGENRDVTSFVAANLGFDNGNANTYREQLVRAATLIPGVGNLDLSVPAVESGIARSVAMDRNLMLVMFLNQWHTQAIRSADRVLRANRDDVIALYFRSLAAEQQRKLKDALNGLKKALALAPRFTGAYLALGRIELRSNEPKAALSAFRSASKLDPGSLSAPLGIANALLAQQRANEAKEALKQAEPQAKSGKSLFQLALAFQRCGDTEKATDLLVKALNTHEKGAWRRQAVLLLKKTGNSKNAE